MAEITREQIKNVLAHYEYEPHSAFVEGLEVQDLRAICDLALQALRQQEGMVLNQFAADCHKANEKWWTDPLTGQRIERNKGELLMLIVSEVAEAMEGERKDLMDDHLPHRKMAEVELADVLIRVFDYAGAYGYDLDGAVAEKRAYNAKRADHSFEARLSANGKKW